MDVHFRMTVRQKAVFECLRAPHSQDFLLVIPIEGLGQHMSPVEYRTTLKYRLMIPIFPVDETCIVCRKACLDTFGEHVVHCRELLGFKYRHDMVRDVLFDVFRRAGVSAKKEAPVNFLTDPLEGSGGFTAGQAALKAASCKVAKHEKTCMENQHAFMPFAFDTFGFLVPEVVDLIKRIQKVMHSNVMTPRYAANEDKSTTKRRKISKDEECGIEDDQKRICMHETIQTSSNGRSRGRDRGRGRSRGRGRGKRTSHRESVDQHENLEDDPDFSNQGGKNQIEDIERLSVVADTTADKPVVTFDLNVQLNEDGESTLVLAGAPSNSSEKPSLGTIHEGIICGPLVTWKGWLLMRFNLPV
ncbi:hypothetical protein OROMI_023031 [Orobanche minor]